ncbi:hypothetical protein MKK69_09875 [Methylobacterium sp. J-026]|uniref:hypothetical protein n=1 Tax=Methylobacterium sp. J-026 TaxID=2836624 RepID=UPI001FB90B74|nr:hypothetical protein [Methylobacterium sp. J-026]MCJ2134359.1 hypothetical protein [Methylobacterium sp. J-026]
MLGSAVALVVPLMLLAAPRSDVVALVRGPGSDAADLARLVAEAGGAIVNVGGRPDILIARSDSDGFVGRLYAAGAWLVLDGRLADGCGRQGAALTPRDDTNTGHSTR